MMQVLVYGTVVCPICAEEFVTIMQYAESCQHCGTNMSICIDCSSKGKRTPTKCLKCGGSIKSEAERMEEKYGNKFCF